VRDFSVFRSGFGEVTESFRSLFLSPGLVPEGAEMNRFFCDHRNRLFRGQVLHRNIFSTLASPAPTASPTSLMRHSGQVLHRNIFSTLASPAPTASPTSLMGMGTSPATSARTEGASGTGISKS
jgi:hypothetical protein